jgi:hypothetical protein
MAELVNTLRITGRTAYLKSHPSNENPDFLGTALFLRAAVVLGDSKDYVEKVANFNAQEGIVGERWYSSEQLIHLMYCLRDYDDSVGNSNPNLSLSAVNDSSETLLEGDFTSASDEPVSNSFYFEDAGDEIDFVVKGTGEASFVFGAQFTPLEVNSEPIDRGMKVNKVIQRLDPFTQEAVGPAITSAEVGEMVKVTIEIVIPDYAPTLTIVDPFPGALEALDDSVYDTPNDSTNDYFYGYWNWYLHGAFREKEFLRDKVIFYGQNIYAGTHSVSYVALVNSQGEWVLPPAIVFDAFQPEVMGLSAGGSFSTASMPTVTFEQVGCLKWSNRKLHADALASIGEDISVLPACTDDDCVAPSPSTASCDEDPSQDGCPQSPGQEPVPGPVNASRVELAVAMVAVLLCLLVV